MKEKDLEQLSQDNEKKNLHSHEEGAGTKAKGLYSHAEGIRTKASKDGSHAEGILAKAKGAAGHAEGFSTIAMGEASHAEGGHTKANGEASHSEGQLTFSVGVASHAEGSQTAANREASHAEGYKTIANGYGSHAEGGHTTANGEAAHSEGYETFAQGFASHAEGLETRTNGDISHAEGYKTIAEGISSHAEGSSSIADGRYAHAEGIQTKAKGYASHAEGDRTMAYGNSSHAQGVLTTASGYASHAEGFKVVASGMNSHGEGKGTNTNEFEGAHIIGKYGDADASYSWYLANGISNDTRGIAAKIIGKTADMFVDGIIGTSSTNYAEMFEMVDGNRIDIGYFVTLEGKKIRKANNEDQYILGVTCASQGILGASGELRWKNKYQVDEWGRVLYHDVVISSIKDDDEREIIAERIESQPILNPEWNSMEKYISRLKRTEWIAVGLLGQMLIRDDGTCKVNGYCKANKQGIATMSKNGYRVLERTGANQILILFR
ncbi:MAG: hypothetical protein N4A64_04820 [Marinisporobacter sp.]|jgi:autotransporter adhesin|nr:hypothetical protein [Marinisporobacter sp.]